MTPAFFKRLSQEEKQWSIAALAYIAYADGVVSDEEKEFIMGVFPDIPRAELLPFLNQMQKRFKIVGHFPLPPLKHSRGEVRINILHALMALSTADYELDDGESIKVKELAKHLNIQENHLEAVIDSYIKLNEIKKYYRDL